MTLGIIYRFKGINIYKNQCERPLSYLIDIEDSFIRTTVQKFCQCIMLCLMTDQFLCFLILLIMM